MENDKILHDIKYFKNGRLMFKWKNTIISNNYLIRLIGKTIYHIEDGKITNIKTIRNSNPIQPREITKISIIEY